MNPLDKIEKQLDDEYRRGVRDGLTELRVIVRDQDKAHAKELQRVKREYLAKGYSERVKDELATSRHIEDWDDVTVHRDDADIKIEISGDLWSLMLDRESAGKLASELTEASEAEVPSPESDPDYVHDTACEYGE